MRGEDKFGSCCSLLYADVLHTGIIEEEALYGRDLKPLHTDLLTLGRMLVHSSRAWHGKLFVLFISLIVRTALHNELNVIKTGTGAC